MSSITIKNVPEQLLARVRERANAEHRSINKEFVQLVEAALQGEQAGAVAREQVAQQVVAWSNLAGTWACEDAAAETRNPGSGLAFCLCRQDTLVSIYENGTKMGSDQNGTYLRGECFIINTLRRPRERRDDVKSVIYNHVAGLFLTQIASEGTPPMCSSIL